MKKIKKSYEESLESFKINILKANNTDYENQTSVKQSNQAVDKYRTEARYIAENYRRKLNDFAKLLDDEDINIKLCSAICLVELMGCSKRVYLKSIKVVKELLISCSLSPGTAIGMKYWLMDYDKY